jgi:hypothetical protein
MSMINSRPFSTGILDHTPEMEGPQSLIQLLESTPCRRARLAGAGCMRITPELLSHHRRKVSQLRQASSRRAARSLIRALRRAFGRPNG